MPVVGSSTEIRPVGRVGICGKWKDRLDVRALYHPFDVAVHLAIHLSGYTKLHIHPLLLGAGGQEGLVTLWISQRSGLSERP